VDQLGSAGDSPSRTVRGCVRGPLRREPLHNSGSGMPSAQSVESRSLSSRCTDCAPLQPAIRLRRLRSEGEALQAHRTNHDRSCSGPVGADLLRLARSVHTSSHSEVRSSLRALARTAKSVTPTQASPLTVTGTLTPHAPAIHGPSPTTAAGEHTETTLSPCYTVGFDDGPSITMCS